MNILVQNDINWLVTWSERRLLQNAYCSPHAGKNTGLRIDSKENWQDARMPPILHGNIYLWFPVGFPWFSLEPIDSMAEDLDSFDYGVCFQNPQG